MTKYNTFYMTSKLVFQYYFSVVNSQTKVKVNLRTCSINAQ